MIYRVMAERTDEYSVLVDAESEEQAKQKLLDNDFDGSDAACVDQGDWSITEVIPAEEESSTYDAEMGQGGAAYNDVMFGDRGD